VCTMLKFGIKSSPLGHTPTYAPGTTRLENARSVWVAAGMKVPSVNIALKGVRWFRVSGVVLDSQGQPAVFPREGLRANPPPGKVVLVEDVDKGPRGTFEAKLPTGDHVLAVTTMAGEFGHVRVSVKDHDVSGVTIRTSPGLLSQDEWKSMAPQHLNHRQLSSAPLQPIRLAVLLLQTVLRACTATGRLGSPNSSDRADFTFTFLPSNGPLPRYGWTVAM
jgi:hypothetical protein